MNLLEDWGKTVKERSQGAWNSNSIPADAGRRTGFLKKMRFGQCTRRLTGYGIGQMYSPARCWKYIPVR